ncbi:MAG: hypothetical protein ACFFDP_05500 [Promethearchaeota archaeon]
MTNVRYIIGAILGITGLVCAELLWGITVGILPDFLPFVPYKNILIPIFAIIALIGGVLVVIEERRQRRTSSTSN